MVDIEALAKRVEALEKLVKPQPQQPSKTVQPQQPSKTAQTAPRKLS
jgi:hypothetical protein